MPGKIQGPIRSLGVLTGGGDVPGLNPAIKALVYRAEPMGIRIMGLRGGWKGITYIDRSRSMDSQIFNAEDPSTFVPSPGKITGYSVPGGFGVRVDSAAYEDYSVLPYYDSLLAKLIVYAEDRPTAIRRMQRALGEYVVAGIKTNIAFHRAALADESFLAGKYDTRLVERLLASETGSRRLRQAIEETP